MIFGYKYIIAARRTWRYFMTGPSPGESEIIECLIERTSVILPKHFELSSDGKQITIRSVGYYRRRMIVFTPAFIWRTLLDVNKRLQMVFEGYSRSLQTFISSVHGERWPTKDAKPHVVVTNELITIWWGGATEAEASVKLRPILRKELGL